MDNFKLAELRRRYHVVTTQFEFAGHSIELYRPRSADELICDDDFNRDERLPYWAEIWPSAVALARRLENEDAGGKQLLELGCGSGLVTTVAAKLGFSVTATDYYPEALEFAEFNACHNGCSLAATRVIDWRELPADLGAFDWVVAADVLYERAYAELIAAAFAATLKPNGRGVVTDPQRPKAAVFPDFCRQRQLAVAKGGGESFECGQQRQAVDIYEIHRIPG